MMRHEGLVFLVEGEGSPAASALEARAVSKVSLHNSRKATGRAAPLASSSTTREP